MRRLVSLFALAFCLAAVAPAEAQPNWRHQVSLNGGLQVPTSSGLSNGVGGIATYYYRAASNFFIGATGAYHQFGGGDQTTVPLMLTFKYNVSLTGLQPYFGADAGVHLVGAGDGSGAQSSPFGVTPKVGLRVPVSRGVDLDFNVRYNAVLGDAAINDFVGFNVGVAYIFDRIEY
jgi:hypothetical protein